MFDIETISSEIDKRSDLIQQIDSLSGRLYLLKDKDRILLELRYNHGLNWRQLGQLSGKSDKAIARWIRKITHRLVYGDYIRIIRGRTCFAQFELEIAYDHFLLGLGYRTIAKRQQLNPGRVRGVIRKFHQWLDRQEVRPRESNEQKTKRNHQPFNIVQK